MQLVVVMAVRKAVSAATTTFTAISIIRFFIIVHYQLSIINCQLSIAKPSLGLPGHRRRHCLRFPC